MMRPEEADVAWIVALAGAVAVAGAVAGEGLAPVVVAGAALVLAAADRLTR